MLHTHQSRPRGAREWMRCSNPGSSTLPWSCEDALGNLLKYGTPPVRLHRRGVFAEVATRQGTAPCDVLHYGALGSHHQTAHLSRRSRPPSMEESFRRDHLAGILFAISRLITGGTDDPGLVDGSNDLPRLTWVADRLLLRLDEAAVHRSGPTAPRHRVPRCAVPRWQRSELLGEFPASHVVAARRGARVPPHRHPAVPAGLVELRAPTSGDVATTARHSPIGGGVGCSV